MSSQVGTRAAYSLWGTLVVCVRVGSQHAKSTFFRKEAEDYRS